MQVIIILHYEKGEKLMTKIDPTVVVTTRSTVVNFFAGTCHADYQYHLKTLNLYLYFTFNIR